LTYITKCKALKGQWLKYNQMTERWEYLHMSQSIQEKMSKRWAIITEQQGIADDDDKQGKVQKVQTLQKMHGKKVQKLGGGKRGRREAPENDTEKKPKSNIDGYLNKAMRTKNQYFVVNGAVQALHKKVQTDEATINVIPFKLSYEGPL
jgi:hypothetical protein